MSKTNENRTTIGLGFPPKASVFTHERMTRVLLMGYTIRIWERVPIRSMGPNHEYTVGLRSAVTGEVGDLHVTPEGMAAILDARPEVAAYEITDPLGNGCVVYRDWP